MIRARFSIWSVSRPRLTDRSCIRATIACWRAGSDLLRGKVGLCPQGGDGRANLVRGVGDQRPGRLDLPADPGHELVHRTHQPADLARHRDVERAQLLRRPRRQRRAPSRRNGPSAERIEKAASADIRRPATPTTTSAFRVISSASARRARRVWPTTTSTGPSKPRSAKSRRLEAKRAGSPPNVAVVERVRTGRRGDVVSRHHLPVGIEDRVDDAIVRRQRQQLEGAGRQIDDHLAVAERYRTRDLARRTDQQPVVGALGGAAAVGEGRCRDCDAAHRHEQRQRETEPDRERHRAPRSEVLARWISVRRRADSRAHARCGSRRSCPRACAAVGRRRSRPR